MEGKEAWTFNEKGGRGETNGGENSLQGSIRLLFFSLSVFFFSPMPPPREDAVYPSYARQTHRYDTKTPLEAPPFQEPPLLPRLFCPSPPRW